MLSTHGNSLHPATKIRSICISNINKCRDIFQIGFADAGTFPLKRVLLANKKSIRKLICIHTRSFTFASIHTSDAWNTQTQSVSDSRNPGLNVVTYQIEWKMIRKIHEFVVKIIANLPAVENWTKKPSKKTTKLLLLLAISVSPCSRRAYNVGCGPYTNRIVISSVARIFRFVRSYAWIIFGAFHTHTSSRCVIKMTENGDERTRTRIKLK